MNVRKMALRLGFAVSLAMPAVAATHFGGMTVAAAAETPAAAPKGDTTATLSAANREKLLANLKEQKKQLKAAHKTPSSDAKAQAAFDARLKEYNRLISGLEKDQEFPMAEVNKALAPPH